MTSWKVFPALALRPRVGGFTLGAYTGFTQLGLSGRLSVHGQGTKRPELATLFAISLSQVFHGKELAPFRAVASTAQRAIFRSRVGQLACGVPGTHAKRRPRRWGNIVTSPHGAAPSVAFGLGLCGLWSLV